MDTPCDVTVRDRVATVMLNRPEIHNAFDETLIAALTATFVSLDDNDEVRAVVLAGAGKSFCAGADLNWMKRMAAFGKEENLADANALAAMLRALYALSKPTIARVGGAAYGGGVGLVACCDIAIGVEGAKFSLSEVKLGLVPAVISPYVIAAIGLRQSRRFFVSGEIFDATVAARIGLLHECVAADQLDAAVDRVVHFLGKGGPLAQAEAKQLALRVGGVTRESAERLDVENAKLIAHLRVSAEGQSGLAAFLEKRAPDWAKE